MTIKATEEDWLDYPEESGWHWFCGRYTAEHEWVSEPLFVFGHKVALDFEPEGFSVVIGLDGEWLGSWLPFEAPDTPKREAEMRRYEGYDDSKDQS